MDMSTSSENPTNNLESEIEKLLIQNETESFYGAFGLFKICNLG